MDLNERFVDEASHGPLGRQQKGAADRGGLSAKAGAYARRDP
jgi:hypothetical protein